MSFARELRNIPTESADHLAHFRQETSELGKKPNSRFFPDDKNAKKAHASKGREPGYSRGREQYWSGDGSGAHAHFHPVLTYFMLSCGRTCPNQVRTTLPPGVSHHAYVTMGRISAMMKGFNRREFSIGLFMSICSADLSGFWRALLLFSWLHQRISQPHPYLGIAMATAAADRGRLRRNE